MQVLHLTDFRLLPLIWHEMVTAIVIYVSTADVKHLKSFFNSWVCKNVVPLADMLFSPTLSVSQTDSASCSQFLVKNATFRQNLRDSITTENLINLTGQLFYHTLFC
jgi:hypothetical protein